MEPSTPQNNPDDNTNAPDQPHKIEVKTGSTVSAPPSPETTSPVSSPGADPGNASSTALPTESAPAADEPEENKSEPARVEDSQPEPKKKTSKPAVIVAIIIGLVLAGLTVFAYLKTRNQVKPVEETTSQTTEEAPPATASDVDQTASDLDAALAEVDEDKDFQSNDLADTTLGL